MTIEGSWITKANATYGVIHRMAVSSKFRNKGVAKFIFEQCEQLLLKNHIDSMRIDTHQDNLAMPLAQRAVQCRQTFLVTFFQ